MGLAKLAEVKNASGDLTQAQERAGTPWFTLGVLVLAAFMLRVYRLDQGLWYDEIRTLVDSVRSPLSVIVSVYPGDNQHTLYSILAHLSIEAFGEHAWSLRLPAVLFGAATIPLLYWVAREFTGRAEALLAAALLTVSYHHVWFSQSARGYAILAFLALLCTLLLLRGLRRDSRSDFVWYGVLAAAAAYTHVSMVFMVAAHAVLCILPIGWPSRRTWARWLKPTYGFAIAAVLTVALYLPFLVDVRTAVVDSAPALPGTSSRWAVLEVFRAMQIGLAGVVGAAAGLIVVVAGLSSYWRQRPFLLGLFVLPGVFVVAANVGLQRPVRPRFVFFLAGFLVLVAIRGALEIGRWLHQRVNTATVTTATPAGVVLAVVLMVYSAASLGGNYRLPKQDFVGAMAYVDATRATGDSVATAGGARFPYGDYFKRDWFRLQSADELVALRRTARRVWVVHTMDTYIRAETPAIMDVLEAECIERRSFVSTVAGGEIGVCLLRPVPPMP